MEELKEKLKKKIIENLDLAGSVSDEEIAALIDRSILEESGVGVGLKEKATLRRELFNTFRRLDVLTEYLEDESISEIMVNGCSDIFIEKNGRLLKADKHFSSEEKLDTVIQRIVADCNRRVNEASPIVDARLGDGSRVNVVTRPVSLEGSVVTIRKFPKHRIDMAELIRLGAIDSGAAAFLRSLVEAGYNIFISGGTGSGKTTFLNALSEFIPSEERIITIEDSAELRLLDKPNVVRLEARNANIEGTNEITIRDLIKTSLRMRPDRIILISEYLSTRPLINRGFF